MPMPLQETQQDLARQAQKAGIPRSETEQEMMMGRAKDRAAGIGPRKSAGGVRSGTRTSSPYETLFAAANAMS